MNTTPIYHSAGLCTLSLDNMHEKGIEIQPKRNIRYPAKNLTNLDFADLALLVQSIKDAEALLQSLKTVVV